MHQRFPCLQSDLSFKTPQVGPFSIKVALNNVSANGIKAATTTNNVVVSNSTTVEEERRFL